MGAFLRLLLIGVIGYFIIKTIGNLLGFGSSKSKGFPKDKTTIKKDISKEDREFKGGDYIDYEEVD